MFNFLHSITPSVIAFTIGPLSVRWYGIIIALALVAAMYVTLYNSKFFTITKDQILDIVSWLIIGGIAGARLYEVFIINFSYYKFHLTEIFAIWNGGLAIHGALIGGFITLYIYTRRKKLQLIPLLALFLPSVALGQAIGRWGNWFNQELFGRPTSSAWGIPIESLYRPLEFSKFLYFHPTFLYESLGCVLIFLCLRYLLHRHIAHYVIIGAYCVLYGLLRFSLEYIKIDPTPEFMGLRWPQVMSLILVLGGIYLFFLARKKIPPSPTS